VTLEKIELPKYVDRSRTQQLRPTRTLTLTPRFMNERGPKGYFCDEPYTGEYSFTHKKLQVYVMEIQEPTSNQEISKKDQSDPQISVSSSIGVTESLVTLTSTLYISCWIVVALITSCPYKLSRSLTVWLKNMIC